MLPQAGMPASPLPYESLACLRVTKRQRHASADFLSSTSTTRSRDPLSPAPAVGRRQRLRPQRCAAGDDDAAESRCGHRSRKSGPATHPGGSPPNNPHAEAYGGNPAMGVTTSRGHRAGPPMLPCGACPARHGAARGLRPRLMRRRPTRVTSRHGGRPNWHGRAVANTHVPIRRRCVTSALPRSRQSRRTRIQAWSSPTQRASSLSRATAGAGAVRFSAPA